MISGEFHTVPCKMRVVLGRGSLGRERRSAQGMGWKNKDLWRRRQVVKVPGKGTPVSIKCILAEV